MTKKDFIALADAMRRTIQRLPEEHREEITTALCVFCRGQNPRFDENRWRQYLAELCGPNGGAR